MFITNVLRQHAISNPDSPVVLFENNHWTYSELYRNAQKIAAYLQQQGFKQGDIVAQYMLNSDLFLAVYYGVQLAGLTVMPVNTKLATPEVEYIFSHSQAKVLIFDEKIEETILNSKHPFQQKISVSQIKELLQQEGSYTKFPILDVNDTAVVMYTSGTTGKPKGVMLSHRNIYETAEIWSESMKMTTIDRMYICTPLFHCAGSHVFAVPMMYKGGAVIIEEAFSPDRTLKNLVDTKATIFFGVPAMYTILLNKPE